MPDFFLQNPADLDATFKENNDKWDEFELTDTVTQSIWTIDTDHDSCLRFKSSAKGRGIYKRIVGRPNCRYVFDMAYRTGTKGLLGVSIFVSGGPTLYAKFASSAGRWKNLTASFYTTNISNRGLYVRLMNATTYTASYFIDYVKLQGNALAIDPDDYFIGQELITYEHNAISGRTIVDKHGRHLIFRLGFPILRKTAADTLLKALEMDQATYFDDGNVPIATAFGIVYNSKLLNYSGVTNGMVYPKAYFSQTSAVPLTATNFQAVSFSDTQYSMIGADDESSATGLITGIGKYGYHKFVFKVTSFTSREQIKSLSIVWKGAVVNKSEANISGANLYAWDGHNWVLLKRSRTKDKQVLIFSTEKEEQAKQFVDTSNGFIRLLVQTRATKDAGASMYMNSYYVEAVINKNRGRKIILPNQAILSSYGSVVAVKNLSAINKDYTVSNMLTLNSQTKGYSVGDDRKSIIITSDVPQGSKIEINYRQRYHVRIDDFQYTEVYPGSVTSPIYRAELKLKTVTPVGIK